MSEKCITVQQIYPLTLCVYGAILWVFQMERHTTTHTTHTKGETTMESILYRNKRNTYSIDNSVIKAAANDGKPASA